MRYFIKYPGNVQQDDAHLVTFGETGRYFLDCNSYLYIKEMNYISYL